MKFYQSKINLLLISLALSLSVLFGFSMQRNLSIETPIRIIDFRSMESESLLAWGQENDIVIKTTEEYSDEIVAGMVISQSAIVGERLYAGSTINVVLSKGPDPEVVVNMIDFTGKDIGEIQLFIEENRLMAAEILFEKSDAIQSAFFIRKNIDAASIQRKTPIRFTISTGSKDELTTVSVPDFAAYTRQQISTWSSANNIKANFVEEFHDTVLAGKVISQSQAANTQVYDGSSITFKMSLGVGVVLENFVGKTKGTIDRFILDNGLKVNYSFSYDATQNRDIGVTMSPNASVRVPNGSTVNVTLSLGRISVSNFIGRTLSELNAWVSEQNKLGANLRVTSTQDFNSTVASGQLITQTPSSGDINPGTTIRASVSKGEGVLVATYKGTSNTNIQEGLRLNRVEVFSNSASGVVLEQSISAGTRVDTGTSIALTVSIGKPLVNSFAGQSFANLQAHINTLNSRGANLSLSKSGEEHSTIARGNIISNNSGSVNVGTTISYTLSRGESVTVGNYVGGAIPSGVRLNFVTSGRQFHATIPQNSIISQSINSGAVVDANTTINVVLSDGPVPTFDLTALAGITDASTSYQDSVNIITRYLSSKSGCLIQASFTRVSENVGDGAVISQNPGPGTISCSSTVSVVISDN